MLSQWFVRISAHADRLLEALPALEASGWPEQVCAMQRHWIGLSHGTNLTFRLESAQKSGDASEVISVFTTRVDTIYGVSYLALAPEHPLLERITAPDRLEAVREAVAGMTSVAAVQSRRTAGVDAPPLGVATGAYAIHPMTGERVPVFVADYVLPDYGEGAVMGVPCHDGRDDRFAAQLGLPRLQVVEQKALATGAEDDGAAAGGVYTGVGNLINSGCFTGLATEDGKEAITAELVRLGLGEGAISTLIHADSRHCNADSRCCNAMYTLFGRGATASSPGLARLPPKDMGDSHPDGPL